MQGKIEPPPRPTADRRDESEFYWWVTRSRPELFEWDAPGKLHSSLMVYRGDAQPEWIDSNELVASFILSSTSSQDAIKDRALGLSARYGPLGSDHCVAVNPGHGDSLTLRIDCAEPLDEWIYNMMTAAAVFSASVLRQQVAEGNQQSVLDSLQERRTAKGNLHEVLFPFTVWSAGELNIEYRSLVRDKSALDWDYYQDFSAPPLPIRNPQRVEVRKIDPKLWHATKVFEHIPIRRRQDEQVFDPEKLEEYLTKFIQNEINKALQGQFSIVHGENGPQITPVSLKGILWELIRRAVTREEANFGICDYRKRPWIRTGQAARKTAKYCPGGKCSNNAKQKRHRQGAKRG